MRTWIAFFRGINVGGSGVLPMKELSALLEKLGCREVRTYIQSGNVVFRHSGGEAPRLATRIRQAVLQARGFEPRVLLVEPSELQRIVLGNPFPAAAREPNTLHAFFLADRPKRPDLESLNALKVSSESVLLKGKVFYLHAPAGFGTSKLARRAERLLGVEATARNWRTVTTVLEMAQRPRGAAL